VRSRQKMIIAWMPIPASQPDLTILQRSPQRLQRSRPELRLVKKQHTTVPWTESMYLILPRWRPSGLGSSSTAQSYAKC
jgi:hypothetical protein